MEVSTIGSCPSVLSLDEMAELEDSVASLRRKPSNDEFSRIVSDQHAPAHEHFCALKTQSSELGKQ